MKDGGRNSELRSEDSLRMQFGVTATVHCFHATQKDEQHGH